MARNIPVHIQVQKALKGTKYPTDKETLIKTAKQNKAEKNIMSIIEGLKADKFNNPAEVSKSIGKAKE